MHLMATHQNAQFMEKMVEMASWVSRQEEKSPS
jgi:hypothetical protein